MPDLSVPGLTQSIETMLFSVSTLLYLPVVAALTLLLLYLLLATGSVAAEWRERRRGLRHLVAAARTELQQVASVNDTAPSLDARLERAVQHVEARGLRSLDRIRFAVRIGPALGLMGTLIPMGISLAGLAQGNLAKMAESMVSAFTATVIGLACSVLAYLLALVREHWLRSDLTEIAYAAESVLAGQEKVVVPVEA